MIDVVIDPDLRVGVNQQLTFVSHLDIAGEILPAIGTTVRVWDKNTGAISSAVVVAHNDVAMLVYLAVAWAEFSEVSAEAAFG